MPVSSASRRAERSATRWTPSSSCQLPRWSSTYTSAHASCHACRWKPAPPANRTADSSTCSCAANHARAVRRSPNVSGRTPGSGAGSSSGSRSGSSRRAAAHALCT
ncbi:hypothetical protein OHA72_39645 [Dactylosporangium sp. NBC_01737]|uniref:hypothetical protein n=1 Tax=Dactylosporangium sp. NBC_01737 TaxID=2975959 RepID=UPI002E1309A1|nr:hypothetical protein OHA72_39645 [Dactylosporangium sp. NBC_01737]